MCMEMMDFDGKETVMQMISKNARIFQMCVFYMQQAFMMAQASGNLALAQQAAMDMQSVGMAATMQTSPMAQPSGGEPEESSVTKNARERTSNSTKPREG